MIADVHITDEDRDAAATVTTSGSGHRYEIQLGHLCNNRCVFCASGQLTAMKIARPVQIDAILAAIEGARRAGATHLTFLGGEPTIHKHFLDALRSAVELGFEHIVIFTNGVMFPHPGFIDSVTALGRFEWRISIQGATEEAHVATTGRPSRSSEFSTACASCTARGSSSRPTCASTSAAIAPAALPELLPAHGVRQLHVDIVRPASTGERNEAYLRDIMPRYRDMAPYYDAMLAGFERVDPDFDINVGNLPYCVIPQWATRIHHGGQETVTQSSDAVGLETAVNKYEWHESLRTHLPGCADCVFRPRCTGIFRTYLDLYGGEEFVPVSREALLRLDPARRNLVLLIEPLLAPLRAALAAGALPTGWRLLQDVSEDRRRDVEMRFAHAGGGAVRVLFVAPATGQAAVIRTDGYDVEVEADLTVPVDALEPLLGWLQARLADADPAARLADHAVERALRRSVLRRGRARVGTIEHRLRRRFTTPGWHLEPLQWNTDTNGALVARGPAGARVDVGFTVGVRGNRSQVGVDFKPETDGDAALRTVIKELVQLIRGTDAAVPAAPRH
jgi:hypothetical protein